MITKNELLDYKYLKDEIENIKNRIDELYSNITSIQSPIISDMPVNHNNCDFDKIGKAICKLDELREMYSDKLCKLIDYQTFIESEIDKLPINFRNIIRYRYIDCMSWDQICAKMTCSWKTVHRYHGKALKLLEDKN